MNVQDAFRRLCEVISDSRRKLGIPGVAVGMISGDLEFRGLGVTNVDHPSPVDAETLFQTTKTFTGTAVMLLVEMGKLALDEPGNFECSIDSSIRSLRNAVPRFERLGWHAATAKNVLRDRVYHPFKLDRNRGQDGNDDKPCNQGERQKIEIAQMPAEVKHQRLMNQI